MKYIYRTIPEEMAWSGWDFATEAEARADASGTTKIILRQPEDGSDPAEYWDNDSWRIAGLFMAS